jgi:hypothetical protein
VALLICHSSQKEKSILDTRVFREDNVIRLMSSFGIKLAVNKSSNCSGVRGNVWNRYIWFQTSILFSKFSKFSKPFLILFLFFNWKSDHFFFPTLMVCKMLYTTLTKSSIRLDFSCCLRHKVVSQLEGMLFFSFCL